MSTIKAKNINPFQEKFIEILNFYNIEAQRIGVKGHKNELELEQTELSVSITGDLKGQVFLELSDSQILSLATNMSGMEMKEIDEMSLSAIKEVMNQIAGRATGPLMENAGVECNISTPTIKRGSHLSNLSQSILEIVYETDIDKISFYISLE